MPNDENKIILEFPATNVEIELGETITFDNISGFLDSGRVTYNGDSLTEKITHLENDKADTTYVNTELDKKADKTDTYTKTQVDNIANAKLDKANPTGNGSLSLNRKPSDIGNRSVAIGDANTASGTASFAMGTSTIANHRSQHVFGEFNTPDDSTVSTNGRGNYIEIIGNGTDIRARSNARTLDWDGNETLAGDLTINGNKSITSEISRLDDKIDSKANASDVYTKSQTDNLLNDKADVSDLPDMSQYYDKSEVDDLLDDKANSDDVYGKAYIDTALSGKANVGTSYTKSEEDALLANKADKSDTYTKEQVDDIVYNILPDDTASGSVANFETSLEMPIKSLEVDVNAVQESGTPTPSSPKAISGWSEISLRHMGENVFDAITWATLDRNPNFYSVSSNQEITVLANDGSGISQRLIDVIPNATYSYMSTFASAIRVFDSTGYTISNRTSDTFTAPANGKIAIKFYASTYPTTGKFILAYGSSIPTTWSAYNGNTEVINLGGTYYGGYVTQDKDGKRELVVTHRGFVIDNSLLQSAQWYDGFKQLYFSGCLNDYPAKFVSYRVSYLCDKLKAVAFDYRTTNIGNFIALIGQGTGIGLSIPDCTTQEQAEAFVQNNSILFVYELAEPFTVALPDGEPIATLVGTNNIFADTGDTSVVFKDSVNGYVEKKIASVQALALNT